MGETAVHGLDELKARRPGEVAFRIARLTLEKYFRAEPESKAVKFWLFPQILEISRRWLRECVSYKDNTFPQLLLLSEFAHDASDRIYASIVAGAAGTPFLKPLLRSGEPEGTTRYVAFDTAKTVFATRADKCHVSHVAEDSGWESKLAQTRANP